MGCITDLAFDMLVDVLSQTTVQDPDSGAITRTWEVQTSDVPAHMDTIAGTTGSGGEQWGQVYQNPGWARVEMQIGSGISDRSRIGNIRLRDSGEVLYKEDSGQPTVFEVTQVAPLSAMFVGHYQDQVWVSRAEVQNA